MMRLALILLFSACCATAQAQAIYRSVMPDGRIIFGDKPAPGARESKEVVLRPSNTATPGPTSGGGPTPRQQAIEGATSDVNAAQQNLERARAALEAGRAPKADEMTGTTKSGKGAGGGMRTSDSYDERVKSLEQDVANAQKQVDEAQGRRNDVR